MNDRRTFKVFVGLGVMNDIPNSTTVAFLRERLSKVNVIDERFDMFESYLGDQGKSLIRWMDGTTVQSYSSKRIWMRVGLQE